MRWSTSTKVTIGVVIAVVGAFFLASLLFTAIAATWRPPDVSGLWKLKNGTTGLVFQVDKFVYGVFPIPRELRVKKDLDQRGEMAFAGRLLSNADLRLTEWGSYLYAPDPANSPNRYGAGANLHDGGERLASFHVIARVLPSAEAKVLWKGKDASIESPPLLVGDCTAKPHGDGMPLRGVWQLEPSQVQMFYQAVFGADPYRDSLNRRREADAAFASGDCVRAAGLYSELIDFFLADSERGGLGTFMTAGWGATPEERNRKAGKACEMLRPIVHRRFAEPKVYLLLMPLGDRVYGRVCTRPGAVGWSLHRLEGSVKSGALHLAYTGADDVEKWSGEAVVADKMTRLEIKTDSADQESFVLNKVPENGLVSQIDECYFDWKTVHNVVEREKAYSEYLQLGGMCFVCSLPFIIFVLLSIRWNLVLLFSRSRS